MMSYMQMFMQLCATMNRVETTILRMNFASCGPCWCSAHRCRPLTSILNWAVHFATRFAIPCPLGLESMPRQFPFAANDPPKSPKMGQVFLEISLLR